MTVPELIELVAVRMGRPYDVVFRTVPLVKVLTYAWVVAEVMGKTTAPVLRF